MLGVGVPMGRHDVPLHEVVSIAGAASWSCPGGRVGIKSAVTRTEECPYRSDTAAKSTNVGHQSRVVAVM